MKDKFDYAQHSMPNLQTLKMIATKVKNVDAMPLNAHMIELWGGDGYKNIATSLP